jgi:hypothetical protein
MPRGRGQTSAFQPCRLDGSLDGQSARPDGHGGKHDDAVLLETWTVGDSACFRAVQLGRREWRAGWDVQALGFATVCVVKLSVSQS